MTAKESYGSRFLYAENLLIDGEFKTARVKISVVHPPNTLATDAGKKIDKWTIGFEGRDKLLVLCKTNTSILHFVVGSEPGPKWVGATITLEVRDVEAFGDTVPAIRVIPPSGCKIRRSLIGRLGKKSIWKGGANG